MNALICIFFGEILELCNGALEKHLSYFCDNTRMSVSPSFQFFVTFKQNEYAQNVRVQYYIKASNQ